MRRTRPYLVQSWMDRGIPTGWIDVLSATLDPAGFLPSEQIVSVWVGLSTIYPFFLYTVGLRYLMFLNQTTDLGRT